ncbi:MAG: hypothetical protein K9G58_05790 [Bacteroidales bacterium]|nr:hypothetical protein [Bacteroidales bacterium]MCF8387165.1 hypothetical protein [Bacteroidales bacterium]MCF8397657.1 hypothetical protein [Bacteroidales bacterium]
MKKSVSIICLFIVAMLFSSCSNKIPFTYDLKKKIDKHDLDISRVQFYNSEKIVLRSVAPLDNARIFQGEVSIENGKMVEEIIINKETPGICRMSDDLILGISFEPGNNKTIDFKLNKMSKTYDLKVSRSANESGRVEYDSILYSLQPTKKIPILLIEKDDKYIYQLNQRILKGQKVN